MKVLTHAVLSQEINHNVDIAMSFRALDRFVDPNRALANMAAALRPGGRILITLVNNDVWYKPASDRVRRMLGPLPDRRRWKMTPKDLKRRLQSVGFQGVELYDLLFLSGLLGSKALNWVVHLAGERMCSAALRQVDRLGRRIAPQEGAMFVAFAHKPQL